MGYYAAGNRMHGAPPTGYLPIEEHGIVGDLRTVALVGTDGTVDWYCPSRFDAPFELACHPAFDYGRAPHTVEVVAGVGAVFDSPAGHCVLRTSVPLKIEESGVAATFTLEEGESVDIRLEWRGEVQARCESATPDNDIMIMHAVDGNEEIPETVLDHLEGYRGSRPVRIGNNAVHQRQIDVYGELMDSVYLYNREVPISYDLWVGLSKRLNWLAKHWQEPDEGVWEIRGPRQRFTYSALMTWVAYDRAGRLARDRGLPAPVERWRKLAAAAHRFVQDSCWDRELQAYVMHPGSRLLDASVLVMPLVKFAGPTDPRFLSTLDRIGAELTSDSLVYRYAITGHDGLDGGEGTFNLCSFWYVEALTRAGRVREARTIFEKMLTYSNHLGLYAEQIGASGEALGNFPQAFTHLALISAAINLDRALDRR